MKQQPVIWWGFFKMDKIDMIELGRGYFGVLLLSIDGFCGFYVTNFIINLMRTCC